MSTVLPPETATGNSDFKSAISTLPSPAAALLARHFDRLVEAPDAIQRLRRFILDLVVRGKLVEQDPNDEPAAELVRQIISKRHTQVGTKKSNLVSPTSALEAVEHEAAIPANWCLVKLGTVAAIVMGQSPPGETYNQSGDGLPLINGPVEFSEGPFGRTLVNQYTTAPTNLCEEGDLLLCVRGSTTGRTNIASFRACIGRGVAAIQPYFEGRYIPLVIWQQRANIIAMGRGIAFPSISREQISNIQIPLPPLAEQHRIVAKVDELMALCDRLEAAQAKRETRRNRLVTASLHHLNTSSDSDTFRETARFPLTHLPRLTTEPEHVQQLRETVRSLAVGGKLVAQYSKEDSLSIDLAANDRVRIETAKQDRRADAELQPLLAGEERWQVPASWEWRALADMALFIDYRGQTPAKAPAGVRLITAKNVKRGFINLVPEEFLSEANYLTWMKRGDPQVGDVLFTTEAPMGNAAAVHLSEPFALAQRVICFRLYGGIPLSSWSCNCSRNSSNLSWTKLRQA